MRKHYTAFLSYPQPLDLRIREVYNSISTQWENKRSFDFLPMIPVWKVFADDSRESEMIQALRLAAPSLKLPLKTKGLITKPETGYIFITFDSISSVSLISYSESVRSAMRIGGAEDNMPYGYEPHSSLIKQAPKELDAIMKYISDKLEGVSFCPKSLVLSRATDTESGQMFDTVFESKFIQDSDYFGNPPPYPAKHKHYKITPD